MANFDLEAKSSPLRPMTDLECQMFSEITSLRARLAEAEALLREARIGVKNSAVQFGYPYTEYVARIDAFIAPPEPKHQTQENTADSASGAWDRECVKCGCKWVEAKAGQNCPRCGGEDYYALADQPPGVKP